MLSLLVALVASQQAEPTVAVVLSRVSGVQPAVAAKALTRLEQQLTAAQVPLLAKKIVSARLSSLGLKDAGFCAGKRACLSELGRQLPADVVVGLALSFVKPDLSIVVDAVRSRDGSAVAELSVVLAHVKDDADFEPFAAQLAAGLKPPPVVQKPPVDAPVVVALEPPVREPVVELKQRPSPVPAIVTAAGAGVLLVASVALAISAVSKNGALGQGEPLGDGRLRSPLTESQALALRDGANVELGASVGCGVGALALGGLALILFPREAP